MFTLASGSVVVVMTTDGPFIVAFTAVFNAASVVEDAFLDPSPLEEGASFSAPRY